MRTAIRNPLWWAACLLAVGAGIWIGASQRYTTNLVAKDSRARSGDATEAVEARSRMDRALDQFDSRALCDSLQLPEGNRDEVVKALVDREGWKAWPKVLAITDPALREALAAKFLKFYAERDPWQAFAEWKKHRGEFIAGDWGNAALSAILGAAGMRSADSMIEVLEATRSEHDYSGISTEVAEDFDYARLMDYLASSGGKTQVQVLNMLPSWAARSPVQAAQWMEAHPDFVTDPGQILNLPSAIQQVVAADDLSSSERKQALDALGALPQLGWNLVWAEAVRSSYGNPDKSVLESATLMDRREDYLKQVLLRAREQSKLGSSWDLIPQEERAATFEAANSAWNPGSSAVETEAKERWRKMIAGAWGIDL